MADNSSIFSGSSRYSADFQSVITRSVAIASLPLTQLAAQKAVLNDQSSAISTLENKFAGLRTALDSLQSALTTPTYDISSSNAGVASVSVSGTALAGSYTVKVTEIGSQAVSVSNASLPDVSDPATQSLSTAGSFTLTVDGTPNVISPSGTDLNALVAAINEAGAGVTATIVNFGSSASPEYRLTLQSATYAPVSVSLHDGTSELVSEVTPGVKASYELNGVATPIESDSRSITLAPGIAVNLAGEGETTFKIDPSQGGIKNALTSFAAAYNAAVDVLDKHRGSNQGALSGHSLVFTLADTMRRIVNYSSGSADLSSLTSLGMTFDKDGKLSFSASDFDAAVDGQDALRTFFGGADSTGFLNAADDLLDSVADSTNGLIQATLTVVKDQIADQQQLIDDNQARVDLLQQSLEAQFAAADSLIASLEQRVLFVQGLFGTILDPPNQ